MTKEDQSFLISASGKKKTSQKSQESGKKKRKIDSSKDATTDN